MIKLKAIPVLENDNKIDGFHLMWNPLLNGHLPVKGYNIWRRKSTGRQNRPVCRLIQGTLLDSLHNNNYLLFPEDNNAFTKILYRPGNDVLQGWTNQPSPSIGIAPPLTLSVYDARFSRAVFNVHVTVRIKPPVQFIAAVAFRDNKVVGSKYLTNTLEFTFEESIDRVVFYVPYIAEVIQVCYTDPDFGKPEDWQLIEKELTMPFAGFSNNVPTINDEFNVFKSRIKDGVLPVLADFERVSTLVKSSYPFADNLMLPVTSSMQFAQSGGPGSSQTMNAAPFAMLQTFCQDHNWRAGLGFSYQDQKDLVPNDRYDYKITASFHRHCLEKVFDFHTVPTDTRVGPLFALAGIFFYVATRTRIQSFPKNDPSGNFIKGIQVETQTLIIFPEAVTHFALYCFPSGGAIKIGNTAETYPVKSRTEIKLSSPGDRIILKGNFFITGIAIPTTAFGTDPNQAVEVADYSFNNVYVNTPRLLAPTFLDATNLQDAWTANQKKAPVGLGFLLKWQQPPADVNAISPALWPVGLGAPPPVNLGHYRLEYRKINSANPAAWSPWDEEENPGNATGIIFPQDDYTTTPSPMSFGADLLVIYPDGQKPETIYSNSQKFKHILNKLNGTVAFLPGTHYQYRIWTVDLVGRNSITATESPQRRLEKRQPPPAPAGIADSYVVPVPDPGYELPDPRFNAGDENSLMPKHVYVRVLQPASPGLTAEERNLLGDRDKLTILTWTWGAEERRLDPFVREFRIYFRANEYGAVTGEYLSGATPDGDNWEVPVQLSIPANASEFVNQSLLLDQIPFKILSHPAGNNISIRVASPLTVADKIPHASRFQLFRKPKGEEARPGNWDKRIAVIPIRDINVYQYALETGALLDDPSNIIGSTDVNYVITPAGAALRCWLGVSAADAESYVDDQLTVASTFSPRQGNEGAIVTTPVHVRFYGRPVFNPPPPLDDVDVLVLDEAKSDELIFTATPLDYLSFLSASDRLTMYRISATDLVSLLHITDTTIQLSDAENPDIVTDWSLNPADETELRNAFFNSNRPIPAKFIYGIAKRNDLHLDVLWKQVNKDPVAANQIFTDLVPNKMERYVYRAKLVNEIGMPSENAALFPNMWRSPDKTIPSPVTVESLRIAEEGDTGVSIGMTIKLPASLANGVKGILVFAANLPARPTEQELKDALLLKIPNRPDLLIEQTCRLRVNNLLTEPLFFSIAESTRESTGEQVNAVWNNIRVEGDYDHHACIWAASVSVDNIISPLSRFQKLFTGQTPPVFPDLMLTSSGNELTIAYALEAINTLMYRIESSVTGPDEGFAVIKGWHMGKVGVNEMKYKPSATSGWLRLSIKSNGKDFTGPSTPFNM